MVKSCKILLVDDEPDFLNTNCARLTRRGYSVETAVNCAEAISKIETGWPNVVILDVKLPDMDGIACLKIIKTRWPHMTVLMLTGHASVQAGLTGIANGAADYCMKPIELDELIEKIHIARDETITLHGQ